jgi:hypothetical protein
MHVMCQFTIVADMNRNSRPPGRYIGHRSNIWSPVEGTRYIGPRNGLRGSRAGSSRKSVHHRHQANTCPGSHITYRRIAPKPSRNSDR